MSDIRLKQISIEPNTLDIKGGNVYVHNTNPSTSALTGSIVTLGGIGIEQTSLATNSQNGGALTVKGGAAIGKNVFIGGNVNQSNVNSTLTVGGTLAPRFFIDDESNAQINLAPNGDDIVMSAYDFNVTVNATKHSINGTIGALVVLGGVSISTTENATSFTSGGGALSIDGGAVIGKNLFIGSSGYINGNGTNASLILGPLQSASSGNSASVITSKTTTGNSSTLEFLTHQQISSTDASLALSIDNVQTVKCHSETDSISPSDGSLVVLGGAGVVKNLNVSGIIRGNGTTQSIGIGSGSLTTLGGLGVAKNAYIGENLNVINDALITGVVGLSSTTTRANKLTLFQTAGNLSEQVQFAGLGIIDSSSMLYQVPSSSAHIFKESGTQLLSVSSTGVIFPGINQSYTLTGSGNYGLAFQGNNTGRDSIIDFYSFDGNSSVDNTLNIYSRGTSTNAVNTESLSIGWNVSNNSNVIKSKQTGTGVLRNISLEAGVVNQLLLSTNGNSSFTGNVSISDTTDLSLSISGGVNISKGLVLNGMSIGNIKTGNTRNNLVLSGQDQTSVILQSGTPEISLYNVGTIGSTNTESLTISSSTISSIISTVSTGSGAPRPIVIGAGSFPNIHLATNGNVSINTTSANLANLHVNGSANFAGSVSMGSLAIAAVVATSTIDSTSESTGSVIGYGGLGIAKSAYIGGILSVSSTEANSINTLGGITAAKDIVVNGGMSVGSVIMTNASCSNLAVLSPTNSTTTSTGSIIVSGGAGIQKNLNVGGLSRFNGDVSVINTVVPTSIYLQNISSVNRFSIQQDELIFQLSRYSETGTLIDSPLIVDITTGNLELVHGATIQKELNVMSTIDSSNTSNGAIIIKGGVAIAKNAVIGQNAKIQSVTDSSDENTGALIVLGGAGIKKNLYVGGNTVVAGDLIVNGTTTTINSTITEVDDNMLVVNSGASGSRDAGILFSRYQTINDTGLGDVVADMTFYQDTLPDQTGMSSTQVKFSSLASTSDNYYTGWYIKVASGFSSNQVRRITGYTGSTKIAIVSAWTTQGPAINDTVNLYYKPFVGLFYNELDDLFQLGACIQDPGAGNVSNTDYIGLRTNNLQVMQTSPSSNSTSGSVILAGGLSIKNTANAVSVFSGGSITAAGGASIEKNLIVGGTLTVNGRGITKGLNTITFVGANNQVSPTNVTDALMDSGLFGADIYISVRVVCISPSNVYTNFHLRLVNKITTWELASNYVGDDSGIVFSITSGGQIQYTSPNFTGFSSMVMKYQVIDN